MKYEIEYMFEKSTQNYHVYRELRADGAPVPDGLPKDSYALNCRPTQYIPRHGKDELGNIVRITIESVSRKR